MASGDAGTVLREVGALYGAVTVAGLTDAQLLERFASTRGEAAQAAFEALVVRHGPMVLGVCRGMLRDPHDADDAFQATFLVLVRKAGRLWVGGSLAGWLYAVAHRVSLKARANARRRRTRESQASRDEPSSSPALDSDLVPIVHEEIARLPEKYRVPVVLCYLQGHTHDEAARELCWPVGTVRSRLARGRDRLRGQLVRRGLAPALAALAAETAPESARAAVPPVLRLATVQAATALAARGAITAGTVSAGVATLTEGVLKSMFLSKLKWTAAAVLTTGLVVAGGRGAARQVPAGNDPAPAASPTSSANRAAPGEASPAPAAKPNDPRSAPRQNQQALGSSDSELATPALTERSMAPRELEIRLKVARARVIRIAPSVGKWYMAPEAIADARSTVDLLVAQVRSQIEDLDDELELLLVRVEAKQAEVEGAAARRDEERVNLASTERLNAQKSVSAAELNQVQAKFRGAEAELKAKQAELAEAEVHVKQAKRRIARLKAIDTQPAPDLVPEPAPPSPAAKP